MYSVGGRTAATAAVADHAVAALKDATTVGWVLLGAGLGALAMLAWHVACPRCQQRAAAWRRRLGQGLIE